MSNPFTLEKSIDRSVRFVQRMVAPKYLDVDKAIPRTLISHCQGIAFVKIIKAGLFFLAGNMGGGVIVCKVPDTQSARGWKWSAPVALGCVGLGGGFVFGGEAIDSIIILNTKMAVRAFMGKGQITLGGNVSLAVGPVGRDIEAHAGASNTGQLVAAYSYSQAQGAYIGGTLEGAVMMIRDDENRRFYNSPNANAENILSGKFACPAGLPSTLGMELDSIISRKGIYAGLPDTKNEAVSAQNDDMEYQRLAKSGRDLVRQGLSSEALAAAGGSLAPGWEEVLTPEGTPYYFNAALNKTQWEKPVVEVSLPVAKVVPPPPPPAMAAPKPAIPTRPTVKKNPMAKALYEYKATQPDELSLKVGDRIEVLEKVDANWWKGKMGFRTGLIPATYVQEE